MKSTDSASRISARHLARKAVVYLRQSSIAQVRTHVESTRLQYALKDTAKAYGFAQVEVIDVDLGMSAASGARSSVGFKQLLASVALGEVGMVLSREPASGRRRARSKPPCADRPQAKLGPIAPQPLEQAHARPPW
jgi:hypothetical protein